ncbi:MAG: head-tail connector protein, partial [Desulfovibrionaceae bacterium]|nr:head-tail connector protein [Desulfovibrionaceae bacterium]
EAHWKDLAAHFMPRRSRFLDAGENTNEGDVRNHLEDDIGILALRTLASGMQSGLTSPARPWFSLSMQNKELADLHPVRAWLHECYERMVAVFAHSNFYDQIHMLYRELAAFGTGVMFVEEDAESLLRCRTETAGTYCLDTDASGRVDTIFRRIRMTGRQVADAWPDTCPAHIRRAAENDGGRWLTLLHAVEPNPDWQEGALNASARRFRSVFMLIEGGNEILEVGGYFDFPAMCPRWDTTASDIYGTSPAMDALADCRQLQKIVHDGRLALEKEVNPPLVLSGAGSGDLDSSAGALNVISPLAQGQPAITPLYQVRANLQALENTKAQIKQQIREMFFNDLFLMISHANRQMTATEVAERNAEKMLLLGPVLDRLRSELFQPLIERVWGILDRGGRLPMPPQLEELSGAEIKIEFISILAQAQKQAGVAAISQVAQFVGMMAQLNPQALDKLDVDEAIDEVAEMQGVPPKVVRAAEAVEEIRAARARQEEAAAKMQMAQNAVGALAGGAKAVKDLSAAGAVQAGGRQEKTGGNL